MFWPQNIRFDKTIVFIEPMRFGDPWGYDSEEKPHLPFYSIAL
jgi:hypothetical protein